MPQSTAEMAAVLLQSLEAASEPPRPQPEAIEISDSPDAADYVMSGPAFDRSGYAEEFRNALFGLDETGAFIRAQALPWNDDPDILTDPERSRYEATRVRPAKPGFTHILWDFPNGWRRDPNAGKMIVRTMHETDRFPQGWVQASHLADEIWVPTDFNRKTLIDSGVDSGKILVIPGGFDFDSYDRIDVRTQEIPSHVACPLVSALAAQRMQVGAQPPFIFLSVFDWTRHKGWQILLSAFTLAFKGRADVRLVLKVWSTNGYSNGDILKQASNYLQQTLGLDLASMDQIQFVFDTLSRSELVALYRSSDCFVLPSKGEGWGRIYTEAMAVGLPVIGTRWSANTAFMTDANSYLIDCKVEDVPEAGWREIAAYKGHRWAEPDGRHLEQLMRRVVECPEEAAAKAAAAKAQVRERYSRSAVGKLMSEALRAGQRDRNRDRDTDRDSVLSVRWEGAFFNWHSLALVNREACLKLAEDPEVGISLVPVEPPQFGPATEPRFSVLAERSFSPLKKRADIHIRHYYPPTFNRPDAGAYVHIVAWEYGFLPRFWVEPLQKNLDEIWVYSNYVKQACIESGIAQERLQVIPLGVDTSRFRQMRRHT